MTIEDQLRALADQSVARVPRVTVQEVAARDQRRRRNGKVVWVAAAASAAAVAVIALMGIRSSSTSAPISTPIHASTQDGQIRLSLDLDRSTVTVGESVNAHLLVENLGDTPISFAEPCNSLIQYRIEPPDIDIRGPENHFIADALDDAGRGQFVPRSWSANIGEVGCALALSSQLLEPGASYVEDVVWHVRQTDLLTGAESEVAHIEAAVWPLHSDQGAPMAVTMTTITLLRPGPTDRITPFEALEAAARDRRLEEWVVLWGRSAGHSATIDLDGDEWVIMGSYAQGANPRIIRVDARTGEVVAVLEGPLQTPVPP